MSSYVAVFIVTLLASVVLVVTQRWHGHFSMDGTDGIQKHHTTPTPRIGGVAIMLGLIAAWVFANAQVRAILGPMLLAGIPAFAFGLAEDVTKKVGVMPRLLATTFSGFLAWVLTGVAMQDTGFPPMDWLLSFLPVAVIFTAFAVGGVANAINIIDGFNGLAAGSLTIMLGAMGLIALNVGQQSIATACFLIAVCSMGFGAVNWPLGKVFLGDGGAYIMGFMLAWMAVLLPMSSPLVNGWTTMLVCAYPVLEVFFSVRRRRKRVGSHPGQPDKAHLHHFLHRRLVRPRTSQMSPTMQNGLTSPFCWFFAALPAGWAVVFASDTLMLAVGLAVAVFTYAAVYARLTQFRWCFSAVTLQPQPKPQPAEAV